MDLRTQLKRLSKDTVVFGLGAALQKFIVLLLFPIYARVLSKADFGTQDLVLTAVVVTSMILIMGMDSGAMLHYYDVDEREQVRIRSTFLWSQMLISVPVCALVMLFAAPLSTLLFDRPALAPHLQLGVAAVPFTQIVRALSLILRLQFRTRAFVILTTAGVLFQVVTAVILVVLLRWGITGVFVATLIAAVLQAVLGLVLARGAFSAEISPAWLRSMLRVGLPLVPAGLSVWILSYANRYELARHATLADIGELSVALRISSILLFAISAFETAWGPFAYAAAKDPEVARLTYAKALLYFLALVLPATAALSVFAPEITSVLATTDYISGAALVPLYCFSSVCWVLLYIVGMGVGIAKKTYHNTVAICAAAGLNIAMNAALIPAYGIRGAAVATLVANFGALVYMYFAGQHYFRVTYDGRKILLLVGLALLAIVPAQLADQRLELWRPGLLLLKAGLVTLPFVGVFVFGVIPFSDVLRATNGLRRSVSRV